MCRFDNYEPKGSGGELEACCRVTQHSKLIAEHHSRLIGIKKELCSIALIPFIVTRGLLLDSRSGGLRRLSSGLKLTPARVGFARAVGGITLSRVEGELGEDFAALGGRTEVEPVASSPAPSPVPGRFYIAARELGESRVGVARLTLVLAFPVFRSERRPRV